MQPPHVLVLLCDQMQADRMGFVDGLTHTPTLDRLAREGVHFTNAYTTQGQCVPSRAVLQTGLYAHECGVMVNYGFYNHQNRLGPQHTTVGHVFRDAGYRTVYFGKSHLGLPLERLGYDTAWTSDTLKTDAETTAALGIEHVPGPMRRDYLAAEKAVAWLQDYEPDGQPLFFTFSTNLPHPPFFLEPKYADRYDEDALPVPASFHAEAFADKPAYQQEHREDRQHGVESETGLRTMLRQYLTMISVMDEHLGRVIAEFERLGLWEDTIVLFTADHGDMMGAHGFNRKGTLPYEELYRIPLLVRDPARPELRGRTVDAIASNERFAATLIRLAGLEAPESFRHGDLWPELFGRVPPEEQRAFIEHYAAYWGIHPFRGIVTPTHKYVRYYGAGEDGVEELYDLAEDPHELVNRAGDPALRKVREALAARTEAWWSDTAGQPFSHYESDAFRENRHNAWPAP